MNVPDPLNRNITVRELIKPQVAVPSWRSPKLSVPTGHMTPSGLREAIHSVAERTRPLTSVTDPLSVAQFKRGWRCMVRSMWNVMSDEEAWPTSAGEKYETVINLETNEPTLIAQRGRKKTAMSLSRAVLMACGPLDQPYVTGKIQKGLSLELNHGSERSRRELKNMLTSLGVYRELRWEPVDQEVPRSSPWTSRAIRAEQNFPEQSVECRIIEPLDHPEWNEVLDACLGGLNPEEPYDGKDLPGWLPSVGDHWLISPNRQHEIAVQLLWNYVAFESSAQKLYDTLRARL